MRRHADHAHPDRFAAAPTGPAGPAVNVARLSMAQHTGRALDSVVPVNVEESMDPLDDPTDLSARQTCRGVPRAQPLKEESLTGVEGSDAGEIALVQQGGTDRGVGCAEPACCLDGVPVRAEDVGAEVPEQMALVAGLEQVHLAEPNAQSGPSRCGDHSAQLRVGQGPVRETFGGLQPPLALHPQMGVKGEPGIETMEKVLPTRCDLQGAHASQVGS